MWLPGCCQVSSRNEKITLRTLRGLQPGEIVCDSEVRGCGVRRRSGAVSYILKTRARGRQFWFKIGDVNTWTLDEARGMTWPMPLQCGTW